MSLVARSTPVSLVARSTPVSLAAAAQEPAGETAGDIWEKA